MKELGIYVHIPFCAKKCDYCDFVSFANSDKQKHEKYVQSVIKEIQNFKLKDEDYIISTIYIGGGTPSYIDEKHISKIVQAIFRKFKVAQSPEITLEVNPGTSTLEKLKEYKAIGVKRLSIGLQSTNDMLLKTIGRIHTYDEFLDTYIMAREVGFESINVDLMLALPKQTIDDVELGVKKVIRLNPEHISCYSLILEEGTKLEKQVKSGDLLLPTEDEERKMYWCVKEELERAGYNHYEISNFAKKGYESKHNLNSWNQEEYLGFGLNASSFYDETRYKNIKDLDQYIRNCETNNFNNNIIVEEENRTQEQIAKEYMMLGLRKLEGISISEFQHKFELNPLFYFRFEISKLQEQDLIEVDLDNIRLTKKGLDFANVVFEEFV